MNKEGAHSVRKKYEHFLLHCFLSQLHSLIPNHHNHALRSQSLSIQPYSIPANRRGKKVRITSPLYIAFTHSTGTIWGPSQPAPPKSMIL